MTTIMSSDRTEALAPRMYVAFLNPQGNFDRHDSYLTEHPDFGGQLVYVKELALALARRGVRVDILTRRIEDPQWPGFSESLDDFGELADQVRIVRLSFGGPAFLNKESLWPHLGEYVDRIVEFYRTGGSPDYLSAHYADGAAAAVMLRQRTGTGFTLTSHSLGAQKMDKLGVSRSNYQQMERRFHFSQRLAAERAGMRWADTIITSTEEERFKQYAHLLYRNAVDPLDDERFRVIAPGINQRIFNQDRASDDEAEIDQVARQLPYADQPHIVVSSRLDAKKNIAGVVQGFCRSEQLNQQARLALFTRGTNNPWRDLNRFREAERAVLEPILKTIEDSGQRERVHFVDIGSQRQLACAYRLLARSGSVFALPSLFEPFGLAPIEAAACGLAVAATRNGGPSEIFRQGSGELFDPADPDSIARALNSALHHRDQLVGRANQTVVSRYTWESTASGYLETMQANLAMPRRQPPEDSDPAAERERLIEQYLNEI